MKRFVDQPRLDSLINLHPGYDMIMPEPGKVDSWNCQVCGAEPQCAAMCLARTAGLRPWPGKNTSTTPSPAPMWVKYGTRMP